MKDGSRYLEAAQQRRRDDLRSPRQAAVAVAEQIQEVANHMAPAIARLQDHMNSPEMRSLMEQARALAESPQVRRMQEFVNRMEARHQRILAESPVVERVKEMELAYARHLQAIADNPAIRQLRERMEDPKFQEQMKQMQRAAERISAAGMYGPQYL
jgi:RecJ-like exonuclease